MRPVKTLGITLTAAMLAWAFLGAGSASADTLCKKLPEAGLCPAGEAYALPALIEAETSEARFVAGAITVKCQSTAKGEIQTNVGPEMGMTGELTELFFWGCVNCETAVAQGLLYNATLTAISLGTANLAMTTGSGGGIPRVEFINCGGLTCIYGAPSVTLRVNPSANPTAAAKIEIFTVPTLNKQAGSSAMCPATAEWKAATYTVSSPLPLWVTRRP